MPHVYCLVKGVTVEGKGLFIHFLRAVPMDFGCQVNLFSGLECEVTNVIYTLD